MEFNKLVRDRIPEVIAAEGRRTVTRKVEGEELLVALHNKLSEEVAEFLTKPSEEELADIYEVLLAIAERHGFSWANVEQLRKEKAERRGVFQEGIILERTEE